MASNQSVPPPNASDEKFQNPGAKSVQSTNMDQQNSIEEPVKQSSTSVFVNSEPMREEQVQNAVKFLSHPRVRGSPIIYRRSFLEKKGLTKEEIDEAFRRVPDSHPDKAGENQDGQLKSSSNIQPQAQAQALQPSASASTGTTTLATVSRSRFHWSHAFFAIGFLAASGAGTVVLIKKSILPWLKSWIRKVVLEDDPLKKIDCKPSIAEETAQAAKAAAAAAADVAKVSQEMLISQSEGRRYFGELVTLVDNQVQEMKLMTNAIRRLEASSGATSLEQDRRVTQPSSKQQIANGKVDYDLHSGRNSSTPASAEPSTAPPHPKSYMEIMAMVQRGEKPSNIREINDLPPNPNQQPSNPRLAPRTKPWEVNQVQHTTTQMLQSQVNGQYLNSMVQDTTIQVNNDDVQAPWWQKKNVRIREIDNEDEAVPPYYTAPSSQQPVKRTWVPPQPPPIAMPEAAEAIRRPKPAAQKEPVPDDQSSSHSSDMSGDSQRIPKTSEPEGAIEGSNLNSMPISREIQEVQ